MSCNVFSSTRPPFSYKKKKLFLFRNIKAHENFWRLSQYSSEQITWLFSALYTHSSATKTKNFLEKNFNGNKVQNFVHENLMVLTKHLKLLLEAVSFLARWNFSRKQFSMYKGLNYLHKDQALLNFIVRRKP